MLPLGVVIPTRNSIQLLPDHLAALKTWIGEAQEVVCVDSFSTDGTTELLKAALHHPKRTVLSHPPGLYQSWNFAIQQVSSPYVYIATVGDRTTLNGLRHLLDTAQHFECDLVLSPPRFRSVQGEILERKYWTIHHYLDALKISSAQALPRAHLFITSVFAGTSGMMGSSASNLYRTALLREHPFPTDFGHIGDTAWGVRNALRVRAAITPEKCAEFVIHPNEGNFPRDREAELERKLLACAREVLREAIAAGTIPPGAPSLEEIFRQYESHHLEERAWDNAYYRRRSSSFPWLLHPLAWRARMKRDRHRRTVRRLWLQSLWQWSF